MVRSWANIIIVCLLLTGVCCSAFAGSKKAPLPDAVGTGKSVYLANKTGNQAVLDSAYEEFSKWGRFAVSKSKDEADITAVFSSDGRLYQGTTHVLTTMTIYVKGSDDAAYETTERHKVFGSAAKSCVNNFKKRLSRSD